MKYLLLTVLNLFSPKLVRKYVTVDALNTKFRIMDNMNEWCTMTVENFIENALVAYDNVGNIRKNFDHLKLYGIDTPVPEEILELERDLKVLIDKYYKEDKE